MKSNANAKSVWWFMESYSRFILTVCSGQHTQAFEHEPLPRDFRGRFQAADEAVHRNRPANLVLEEEHQLDGRWKTGRQVARAHRTETRWNKQFSLRSEFHSWRQRNHRHVCHSVFRKWFLQEMYINTLHTWVLSIL